MELIRKHKVSLGLLGLFVLFLLLLSLTGDKQESENETVSDSTTPTEEIIEDEKETVATSTAETAEPTDTAAVTTESVVITTTSLLNTSTPQTTTITPRPPVPATPTLTTTFTPTNIPVTTTNTAVNAGATFDLRAARVNYLNNDHTSIVMNFSEFDDNLNLRVSDPFDSVALLRGISGLSESAVLERTTFTYNELRMDKAREIGTITGADIIVRSGHTRVTIVTPDRIFYFWVKTGNVYEAVDTVADYLRYRTDRIWDLI